MASGNIWMDVLSNRSIAATTKQTRRIMQTTPPKRILHMDEKSWWDFWNTSYRAEDGKDAISTELFARVASVIGEIAEPRNCRVLEIACGSGTLSRSLPYAAYQGIDISPAAIEIACEKARGIIRGLSTPRYEVADFHECPVSRDAFDLVICVDAIFWFRDQRRVLEKMFQSLRGGGKLVLTALNPFVYGRIKRTGSNPIQEGPVSRWLSKKELHEMLQSVGFVIERSCTVIPRGNRGILRIINSPRLNRAFGPHGEVLLRDLKERVGLGQYRVLVAVKERI